MAAEFSVNNPARSTGVGVSEEVCKVLEGLRSKKLSLQALVEAISPTSIL